MIFYLNTFSLSVMPKWERTDIYGEGNRLTFVSSLSKTPKVDKFAYIEVQVFTLVRGFGDQ